MRRVTWLVLLSVWGCDDAGAPAGGGPRADAEVDAGVDASLDFDVDGAADMAGPEADMAGPEADMAGPEADMAGVEADMAEVDAAPEPEPDMAVAPVDVCEPLPRPEGDGVVFFQPEDDVAEIARRVRQADPGATFVFLNGTYDMNGEFLFVSAPGVTIRGETSDRTRVVLDGASMSPQLVSIRADDVTIAHLTLRRAFNHGVFVTGGVDAHSTGARIHDVEVVDAGRRGVAIDGTEGFFADRGTIECSRIALTDDGRANVRDGCDTGGVDARGAVGWTVTRNEVTGFWCVEGLAQYAIHFWRGSKDTLVERNLVTDNARGVGLGLGEEAVDGERAHEDVPDCQGYIGHWGGFVRNNFVAASDPRLFISDGQVETGIGLEAACDARVVHNSVAFTQAPRSSGIEWRFAQSRQLLANNLSANRLVARDGASATLVTNVESVPLGYFVDVPSGDLHLTDAAEQALGAGSRLAGGFADEDYDGELRTEPRDVGADERE